MEWDGVYILVNMGKIEEIGNCYMYTEHGPGSLICGENGVPQKCLILHFVRVGLGCIFG